MTTPPDPTPPPPLDYHKQQRSPASTVVLGMAIAFALCIGCLCGFALLFMGGDTSGTPLAFILGVGLCLLVIAAILAVKRGMSAAVAITLAAGCAFLLMLGLCSQFTLKI